MFRILTAAAILALTAATAQAEDLTSASVTVDYGDLNLFHASDAQVLAERLSSAAKSVCLSTGYANGLLQDCMDAAVSNAKASIESSMESKLDQNIRVHLDTGTRQAMANP
jgi:UrcA family protein